MTLIKDLLEKKESTKIFSLTPEDSVLDAVTSMVENNIGAMLVIQDDVIQGILTERDYLRFISKKGHSARETPIKELMTRKIIYVTPETSLEDVMGIMTEARIRHLPVMLEGQLLGMVSIGDVVKQISQDREVHISTLQAFISDPYPGPVSRQAKK